MMMPVHRGHSLSIQALHHLGASPLILPLPTNRHLVSGIHMGLCFEAIILQVGRCPFKDGLIWVYVFLPEATPKLGSLRVPMALPGLRTWGTWGTWRAPDRSGTPSAPRPGHPHKNSAGETPRKKIPSARGARAPLFLGENRWESIWLTDQMHFASAGMHETSCEHRCPFSGGKSMCLATELDCHKTRDKAPRDPRSRQLWAEDAASQNGRFCLDFYFYKPFLENDEKSYSVRALC